MNNAQEPAFPEPFLNDPTLRLSIKGGLTKREYFAAMAMQGLAMNRILIYDYIGDETKVQFSELISKEAIRISDELLKQLES